MLSQILPLLQVKSRSTGSLPSNVTFDSPFPGFIHISFTHIPFFHNTSVSIIIHFLGDYLVSVCFLHQWSPDYVPRTLLSTLHILPHLNPLKNPMRWVLLLPPFYQRGPEITCLGPLEIPLSICTVGVPGAGFGTQLFDSDSITYFPTMHMDPPWWILNIRLLSGRMIQHHKPILF